MSVSAGFNHTCALLSTKTVKCWGDNGEGNLGNGTTSDSSVPVAVKGLTGVTAIAAGGWQACALLSTGTVKCWGDNALGDLGDGTFTGPTACILFLPCSTTPVAVKGLTGATAIASGSGWHSCARLSTGTVKCWGDNEYGELGNGRTGAKFDSSVPVFVEGLTGVTAVSALGSIHSCALLSTKMVKCWGDNSDGDLGNGTTVSSSVPVAVKDLTGVTSVSAGDIHNCALLSTKTVNCWGDNGSGDLGNGTRISSSIPVAVKDLSGVTAIAAGGEHSCARLSTGTVKCWGDNSDGDLGNGTTISSSVPVAVTGL
jgi:alpha-tubulin suppressor-like RCC1 family protein